MEYNAVAESGAMLLARTWNKAKYKKKARGRSAQ